MTRPKGGPDLTYYTWPNRYQTYAFFPNLQAAYDPTTGNLYIGRGYPYPFDRGAYEWPLFDNTPTPIQTAFTFLTGPNGSSPVQGCAGPPATFPNRIQIYRMNIGTLSTANMQKITSNTWTKVLDIGGQYGYAFDVWLGGPSLQTPLLAGQTNVGRDYGAVSFLRDGAGNLMRYGSSAYYFAADTYVKSKGGTAPCRITGTERVDLLPLP